MSFASLAQWSGTVAELASTLFDPSINLDDLAWLRDQWPGKLIVKGITSLQDATDCVDVGVDAVVISNHGGRQLDRSPASLDVLPRFVDALGDQTEIMVDGGFLSGSDVVVALCLGATAVLVGRAYLYGLMAAGEAGVRRTTDLLATEMVRTMQLLGAPSVKDLSSELLGAFGDRREALH